MSRPRSIRQAAKAKRDTDIWEAAPQWWRDTELTDESLDEWAAQFQRNQIEEQEMTDERNSHRTA